MKIVKLTLLLIVIISSAAFSQSITLFDVDASNFPLMRAKFYAFDEAGNQQRPGINQLSITENGIERTITNVSCPPAQPPRALSSVLTIDVSGSMNGGDRINIAKSAASSWVDGLLGLSECAITTFNSGNYLNQDFTTDKQKLLNVINSIYANGGTDYDAALLNQMAGGLQVSKKGKFHKVIVMLTDGSAPEPKINDIINEAGKQNCNIYVVTLGMPCPISLQTIATQTGGQWFENILTNEEAVEIYKRILYFAQNVQPCTIEWESTVYCDISDINIQLHWKNVKGNVNYILPQSAVANLNFVPPFVSFKNVVPGITKQEKVTLTARNADFVITDIIASNPLFSIEPTSFSLLNGQSQELTVSFTPTGAGYNYCKFDFINDVCARRFLASGGNPGIRDTLHTLKLIHPNGGEVFVAGSDTVITWEGIMPDDFVSIQYSTNSGKDWIIATEKTNGLSYNWRAPIISSDYCLASVSALAHVEKVFLEMVLIPADKFIMGNTGQHIGYSQEKPEYEVILTQDFFMGIHEVTQFQFQTVMGYNPSTFVNDEFPVNNINWLEAIEFCNRLSDIEGLERSYTINGNNVEWNEFANGYRLPTEAEWEYSARAGTFTDYFNGSLIYSQCNPLDVNLDEIGWYCGNSNFSTQIVGLKQANGFGLFDMNGNISEWCWDRFSQYTNSSKTNPKGGTSGDYRIIRGGSWSEHAENCRSSNRSFDIFNIESSSYGFRVVRNF